MLFSGLRIGTNSARCDLRRNRCPAAAPPRAGLLHEGYDAFAGVIKSGGKTRRAAKMVILNVDHPDIMEYIGCKAEEEKKAWRSSTPAMTAR